MDIEKRIGKLKHIGEPLTIAGGSGRSDTTLLIDDTQTKPTFGRYEILKELGRGAMGTVYLGRDPTINRQVAIKTMEYAEVEERDLPDVKARFFREAEAAGKLSHPNIVAIYDAGEEHDMAYIAMELLIGEDLTQYCHAPNLLPVSRVLEITAAVADALDYAHKQGVVHRDIKPANIMLLEDGQIKVTDFGIARVVSASQTRTGIILGTPSYMSPEQVSGKKVDGRSDLFSLGIVLYELLAGTKPFKGDSVTAIMYAISHNASTPLAETAPQVPECCQRLVDKLLTKGLTRRFSTAAQVLKAIAACQSELA
jgi:serine/threonine-protein kinase